MHILFTEKEPREKGRIEVKCILDVFNFIPHQIENCFFIIPFFFSHPRTFTEKGK